MQAEDLSEGWAHGKTWRELLGDGALLLALIVTIPAFYLELMPGLIPGAPRALAGALYLTGAAAACAAGALHRAAVVAIVRRRVGFDVGLGLSLLLAAWLPSSEASLPALLVRLLVAALMLVRSVQVVQPWLTRGSLPYLLALSVVVLGVCGAGFWWLEPRVESFGDGLWLAFTTAATVGFGDIVPSTPAARIFSVFVVLLGYAVLSLVTAAIAARWVETQERQLEHDLLTEMHRELSQVRRELAELREALRR